MKETVIIVHGTWAAPKSNEAQWYHPVDGDNVAEGFVNKLNAALHKRNSPARCWAHCHRGDQIFHWSGVNSWIERTRAAAALGDYIIKLQEHGWRCHIVAHSHGGNTMIEALPKILAAPNSGMFVTLGTPFVDTMSPILGRSEKRSKVLKVASWIGFPFLVMFWLLMVLTKAPSFFVIYFSMLIGLFLFAALRRKAKRDRASTLDVTDHAQPRLLAIGSPMDEAWQVLHCLRIAQNPLATRSNFLAYLLLSLRSSLSEGAIVARIHGARSYRDLRWTAKLVLASIHLSLAFFFYMFLSDVLSSTDVARAWMGITFVLISAAFFVIVFLQYFGDIFVSAFFSPFRWCARLASSVGGLFSATVTYGVRRLGWSVLLKMAMGLEGYRFTLPLVEQAPRHISNNFVKYEDMPKGAEQRALDKRNDWITRHLGDVSQTFAKLTITAADISSLLRDIEEDQSLVHGAYYTDDECISRIADWIAGTG